MLPNCVKNVSVDCTVLVSHSQTVKSVSVLKISSAESGEGNSMVL